MRRAVILLLILFALSGGILHYSLTQKIIKGEYVSEHDENINICAQQMLWLPFSLVLGFSFLVYPDKLIKWFTEPLSDKTKESFKQINTLVLRLFGLLLLITTPISSILNDCKTLLSR